MSGIFRKDIHTKAKEAVVPDATKSHGERVKESITDSADRIARDIKPDHNKSLTQGTVDKTGRAKDNVKHGGTHESIVDKVKDALHPKHGPHHTTHHTDKHITGSHLDTHVPK